MPIRKDLRVFYGPEWQNVTRPRILARAGNRCEHCGKPNHATVETISWDNRKDIKRRPGPLQYLMVWKLPTNAEWNRPRPLHLMGLVRLAAIPEILRGWNPSERWLERFKIRTIRVVLTVAHLNHTPGDDRDENLAALCQWCHLIYDLEHHERSRASRKDADRPILTLLSELGAADSGPGQTVRAEFI